MRTKKHVKIVYTIQNGLKPRFFNDQNVGTSG